MANMAERNEIKGDGGQQEVWTIGRILKWTEGYFQKAGLDSPRLDAEVLLSHVLKKAVSCTHLTLPTILLV